MNFDSDDNSNSDTGYSSNAMRKFLKNQGVSTPENNIRIVPKLSDEESSDSYESFSLKKSKKIIKSSQSKKSETDENIDFSTQNSIDYTKLDANNIASLPSDDEESEKAYRRPPPSSVAFHLRTSSDDEDGLSKPKPKPKMSVRKPAGSVAPTKKMKFDNFDDSASQRNERPAARSFAPSTASYKSSKSSKSRKWTKEVINENRLDRELEQLIEIESRLTEAEHEKMIRDDEFYTADNFSKNGDNRSQKSRKQKEQEQEEEEESLQTIAEAHYAKMLKKKFPQLVKKKALQQKMQNNIYNLNVNSNITNWSREMIKNENENIQKEINQISKELKRILKENEELKANIKSYYHDQ